MGELFRDPELDQMINEMNTAEQAALQHEAEELAPLDAAVLRDVADGEPVEALLAEMIRRGASDLLLVPDSPPTPPPESCTISE